MSDTEEYAYKDEDNLDIGDEYEYNDECDVPELKKESSYPDAFRVPDGSYNILDYVDMIPLMEAMIKDAKSVLGVSSDTALVLLSHYGWNKERLFDKYWTDMDACLRAAGLSSSEQDKIDNSASNSAITCSICYDTIPLSETICLNCSHKFCRYFDYIYVTYGTNNINCMNRSCYGQYLKVKVENEGSLCVKTHCPEPKCTERVPDSLFKELLDERSFNKYREFSIKNFIETSNFMRYCPAASCNKVAIGRGITTVVCQCSNPFCFRCGEEAHDPATCSQLSQWLEKCRDESETVNWMIVNTKKCLKCEALTEKTQGCNHMTCRLCKHEYCWICMGPWMEHGQATGGYYKCNKFVSGAEDSDTSKNPDKKAKDDLEKYLHYYTRYQGHDASMKHAQNKQLHVVESRMRELQSSEHNTWMDIEFLRKAVLQVIECRRVLKYTYVLGYSLTSTAFQKELFENTDTLSELTERPLEEVVRSQVVSYTRITEQFLHKLLIEMMDKDLNLENLDSVSIIDNKDAYEQHVEVEKKRRKVYQDGLY